MRGGISEDRGGSSGEMIGRAGAVIGSEMPASAGIRGSGGGERANGLASLQDATFFSRGIPVVSLRSTTGYDLFSLRERLSRRAAEICGVALRRVEQRKIADGERRERGHG